MNQISNEDKQILSLLAEGKIIKEIAHDVGKSKRYVTKQLEKIRIAKGCLNLRHLIYKLSKEAVI